MLKLISYVMGLIHYQHKFIFLNKFKKSLLIGLCVFVCVFTINKLGYHYKITLLIPPIAASCVIIFTLPNSPFSRPKNIMGGHIMSAFIGLFLMNSMNITSVSLALALSLSIFSMLLTDTLHPPAGATTVLVMYTKAGWHLVLFSVIISTIIISIISIVYKRMHGFVKGGKKEFNVQKL
ncbi:HPP family protein [Clostridium tyrobutyricum]|nr:HPP family protein [Clostridium tyrobutyricum]MBV4422372.1 HPP family protein [Clostridium tyrobutyricum]